MMAGIDESDKIRSIFDQSGSKSSDTAPAGLGICQDLLKSGSCLRQMGGGWRLVGGGVGCGVGGG